MSILSCDVYVRANLSLIDSQIRALFPKDDIRLSQANGSVVISGSVADPATSAQIDSVVQAAGFKTVNMLASRGKSMSQDPASGSVLPRFSRNRYARPGSSFAYHREAPGAGYGEWWRTCHMLVILTQGVLRSTFSSLNPLVLGGTWATMIRALQTQGVLRRTCGTKSHRCHGRAASQFPGWWRIPGSDRSGWQ